RAMAMFADPVAGTAQEEAGDAGMTMLAQDDQIEAIAFGVANDRIGRVTADHHRARRNAPTTRVLDRRFADAAIMRFRALPQLIDFIHQADDFRRFGDTKSDQVGL